MRAPVLQLACLSLLFAGCTTDVGSSEAAVRIDGSALCVGPSPAGCRSTGCPRGFTCNTSVGCRPSACSCRNGTWICTADCGGGMCVPDGLGDIDPTCRADDPLSCAGVTECGPLLCPPGTGGCNCACGNRACVPDGTYCAAVCSPEPGDAITPDIEVADLPEASRCGPLLCPPGTSGCNCACGNRACVPEGTACAAVCWPEPTVADAVAD